VNLPITFTAGFAGHKNIYGYAVTGAGATAGWQTLGSWTLGGSGTPSVASVSPSSGAGSAQTFSFVFSDTAAANDLSSVQTLINSALSGVQACLVLIDVVHSTPYLLNDAGTAWLPLTGSLVSNSQCALNAAGFSLVASGNTLTVNLPITFTAGFAGHKNIYGYAVTSAGATAGWQTLGSWIAQ